MKAIRTLDLESICAYDVAKASLLIDTFERYIMKPDVLNIISAIRSARNRLHGQIVNHFANGYDSKDGIVDYDYLVDISPRGDYACYVDIFIQRFGKYYCAKNPFIPTEQDILSIIKANEQAIQEYSAKFQSLINANRKYRRLAEYVKRAEEHIAAMPIKAKALKEELLRFVPSLKTKAYLDSYRINTVILSVADPKVVWDYIQLEWKADEFRSYYIGEFKRLEYECS